MQIHAAPRWPIAALVAALLGLVTETPAMTGPRTQQDGGDQSVTGPSGPGASQIVIPRSSQEQAGDLGQRAHTNFWIVVPPKPITAPGSVRPPEPPKPK